MVRFFKSQGPYLAGPIAAGILFLDFDIHWQFIEIIRKNKIGNYNEQRPLTLLLDNRKHVTIRGDGG